jgi:hypothetical protein
MKSSWMHIVLFWIIVLGLAACQPAMNKTGCAPTASPFATPVTNDLSDVGVVYAPNITITRVCIFRGHVTKGQLYTHEIVKGLVFCLRPHTSWHENDGWDIVISDATEDNCGQGFNGIVTPPFHGMNPIFIEGWHFRNDKNTAENDGSVNAPQEVREFNFLLNRNDFEKVWSAYSCETWNHCENGLTQDKAGNLIAITPKSRGIMTITNFELGNLVPNDKAWFESLDFEVKIYLPAE